MIKPFAPYYSPHDGQWFYRGRYYDENPQAKYEEDLDDLAEDREEDER
jgi:hypothetical protein